MAMTFKDKGIIYYGPHSCSNCGRMICKMGTEFGGNAFDYPEGPIYPNSEWHPHVCDPADVSDWNVNRKKLDAEMAAQHPLVSVPVNLT